MIVINDDVVLHRFADIVHSAERWRNRKKCNWRENESAHDKTSVVEGSEELYERVDHALNDLPERYRLPLYLHHCEGLSFKDIAFILTMSASTASHNARRGIGMLRERLGRIGVPISDPAVAATLGAMPSAAAPATLFKKLAVLAESANKPVALSRLHPFAIKFAVAVTVVVGWMAATLFWQR